MTKDEMIGWFKRICERPTAWLGWEDLNSEMSSQIIPLKDRTDLRESSQIRATETIRVELRHRGYAARG
jgi:hypothetical protein